METNKRGGGTGVSQNKQLLTEKDKEVASHRMEKETVAGAQKQVCTAATQPWLQQQLSFTVCSDDTHNTGHRIIRFIYRTVGQEKKDCRLT